MTTRKKKPSAPAGNDGFSLISNEKLLALYAAMLKCRMLEQHVRAVDQRVRQADRRIGARAGIQRAAAFGAGHEAAVVGAAIDLQPRDAISPPRGTLTPCLVKGVPLRTIFSQLRAQPDALPARYASRRVIAPGADLTAQLKAACRAARLNRKAKNNNIVVLFCNRAELARGDANELLRSATEEHLPILIVCHARPGKQGFAPKARQDEPPHITVDGHDVVAVYRVASEAITHARRSNGPTVIECTPWVVGHAKQSRRSPGDAIRNMEEYLSRKGLFSAQHKAEVTAQFARELERAVTAADGRAARKISVRL
jgi:pyruvate dehydrogenase E1 component alpha subunit